MTALKYDADFSGLGPAIRVGAGALAEDVYAFATANRKSLVLGASKSVGVAGGYLQVSRRVSLFGILDRADASFSHAGWRSQPSIAHVSSLSLSHKHLDLDSSTQLRLGCRQCIRVHRRHSRRRDSQGQRQLQRRPLLGSQISVRETLPS